MMSAFAYDSLDEKTKKLAQELEALGGGDASLGGFEVHAVIDDRTGSVGETEPRNENSANHKRDARTLWIHGKTIGIRDTTQPRSRPSAEVMTYADVSSSMRLQTALQDRNVLSNKSSAIVDWILRGYNACLIGYGQRDIGKTLLFFGAHTKEQISVEYTQPSLCSAILRQLYDKAGLPRKAPAPHLRALEQTSYGEASACKSPERRRPEGLIGFNSGAPAPKVTIAVSCWCVKGNHVLDLCLDSKAESDMQLRGGLSSISGTFEFATIDCNTFEDALTVIHTARGKAMARGTLAMGAEARMKMPGLENMRSHFFCRIIVHRPAPRGLGGRVIVPEGEMLLSHLHLVDLIGKQESEHDLLYANPKLDSVQLQNAKIARKDINLQLGAFTGTLYQMKQHAQGKERSGKLTLSHRGAIVTKARDTLLSSIISPLIQGNCKTLLFAFLKEGREYYRPSLSIMEMVDGLTSLSCPCHRVSGVPRGALSLRSVLSVLPPPKHPDDDIFYSATYELAGGAGCRGANPLSTDPIPPPSPGDVGDSPDLDGKGSPRSGRATSLDDSVAEYSNMNLLGLADGSPRSLRRGEGHSLKSPSEGSDEWAEDKDIGRYKYAPSSALPSMVRTDTTVNQFHELLHSHSLASRISDTARVQRGDQNNSLDDNREFKYDPSGERKKREEKLLAQIEISQREHDNYISYMNNTNKSSAEAIAAGPGGMGSLGSPRRPFVSSPEVRRGGDVSDVPDPSTYPSKEDAESYLRYLGNSRSRLHGSQTQEQEQEQEQEQRDLLAENGAFAVGSSSDQADSPPALMEAAVSAIQRDGESPELAPHEISKISPRKVHYAPHQGAAFRDQLHAIYRLYCPEKLANIDNIAERFKGRETLLLEELHKKYDIEDDHLELFEAHTEGADILKSSVRISEQKTPDDTRTLRRVKGSVEEYRQTHPDNQSTDASETSDSDKRETDRSSRNPLVVDGKLNMGASSVEARKQDTEDSKDSRVSPMKLSSFGMKALSLSKMMSGSKKDKNKSEEKKIFMSSSSESSKPSAAVAGNSPSLLDLAEPNTVLVSPQRDAVDGASKDITALSPGISDSDDSNYRQSLRIADLSAPGADNRNTDHYTANPNPAQSPDTSKKGASVKGKEKSLKVKSSQPSGNEGFLSVPHSPSVTKGGLGGRLASGISTFSAFHSGGNKQTRSGNTISRSRSMSPEHRFINSRSYDISASESAAASLEQGDMSDVTLLRRNTTTLMETINAERRERMRAEDELAEFRENIQEELARKDLEIEDRKLEVVHLKAQMRTMASKEPNLEDAFAVFEAHVVRYQKESKQLRTDLARTQIELMDALESTPILPLPEGPYNEGTNPNSNTSSKPDQEKGSASSVSAKTSAPTNATDVHTSVFEAAINGSRDAAAAVTDSVFAAATRAKAAKQSYRKLQHEYEQLWNDLETLRGNERKYEIGQRIAAESSRRLKESLQQISALKSALAAEKEETKVVQAKFAAVATDLREMRGGENSLREEKARMVSELSMLRERVRQIDDERQRLMQVNAFSLPASAQPVPDLLPTEGHGDDGRLAGNFDKSQYNRREENNVGNISLENALADLHEALVQEQPTLLPLLRKIGNEIHFERTRHLEQRAELLRHVYPTPTTSNSNSSDGGRPGHRRGYSQASHSKPEKGRALTPKASSLSPPRNEKQKQPRVGTGVSMSANSAFDRMARFQAAKARRDAVDKLKSHQAKHHQKSERVKWETVGF